MAITYYNPVEKCIYCGTTERPKGRNRFEEEHIVPLALGGELILPEASRRKCSSKINSQIETPVLDHEWGALRARLGFPTRHRKRRQEKLERPVFIPTADGDHLPISLTDHSTPVPLYLFYSPRILTGVPRDFPNQTWNVKMYTDHNKEAEMQRKFPQWNKTHSVKVRPEPFARMLAKIGYSYAIAEYGLSNTKAFVPLCVDLILGRTDDIFYTVGGNPNLLPAAPTKDGLHQLGLEFLFVSLGQALLIARIRLFASDGGPLYFVVVGQIRLDNPDHAEMFNRHRENGKIMEASLV